MLSLCFIIQGKLHLVERLFVLNHLGRQDSGLLNSKRRNKQARLHIFFLFNSFHFMITLLNSTSKTIMLERWSLSWHLQFHRDHCSFHTSPLDDRLLYKNILFISRHACFFPFYFWYLRSQLHRLHRQETFRNGRRSVTFKSCTLYIRNKADFNCHPLPALPSPTPSPNK